METLSVLVALDAQGEPPTEFRLYAKGEIKTRKGIFLFDDVAAASVMKHAAEFGAEYPIDYGHAMLMGGAANPADQHAAAGWFKPEVRDGELWATSVSWTNSAARRLREREYRYISPAANVVPVELDGKPTAARRIQELLNCALTNVPATKGLTPLVLATDTDTAGASPEGDNDMSTILLATLAAAAGYGAGASENEIIGRIQEHREAVAELVKVTGKDKPKEAVGVALAWSAELANAKAKLETLSVEAKKAKVEAKVAEKIDAFLLEPAKREWCVKLGMQDEEMLDGFLSTCVTKVVTNAPVNGKPIERATGVLMPSAQELKVLGISAEDFAKQQAKMIEEGVL